MTVKCKHIIIETPPNNYFANLIEYTRYHFDTPEYDNTVILICTAINYPISHYRDIYPNKKLIMYNWEQLCGGNKWFNIPSYHNNMIGADELWDYDELNSDYLRMYHDTMVDKLYPLKYTPTLDRITSNVDPAIDILFYGLVNERRSKIISKIRFKSYNKFNVVVVAGGDHPLNDKFIADSKIILNIHAFDPWHREEQERIGFLLSNSKCVLSETSQLTHFGGAIVDSNSDDMFDSIVDLLKDDKWRTVASNGYDRFKAATCNKIHNY